MKRLATTFVKAIAVAITVVAILLLVVALAVFLLAAWALLLAFRPGQAQPHSPSVLLSEVIHEPEQAQLLLTTAGFPRSRIPRFTTPLAFWTRSLEEARNGVVPGGIRPILEQAAAMYPHNPRFAAYR